MKKEFVTFLSPGTFVHEETTLEIGKWDVEKAKKMAKKIVERHNSKPFGFFFSTRSRTAKDLDSKVTKQSGMYYLGGKVWTLAELKKRNDPKDSILISNMEGNGYDRVIENTNSWRVTLPLNEKDTVLTNEKKED